MKSEMPAAELAGWRAFVERLEPIGPKRADWQAAKICATVFNAAGGIDGKPVAAEEMLLKFEPSDERPKQAPSWQAQRAHLRVWVDAHNARVKKERERAARGGCAVVRGRAQGGARKAGKVQPATPGA